MKVTLVRHTSLQVAPGICYGQTDVDIASTFAHEVGLTQQKLKHWQFDAMFSSPMQRCVKLAEALSFGDVKQDDRLKELHFGDWGNAGVGRYTTRPV